MLNSHKKHRLPIAPHLYKWLKHSYGYKDCLHPQGFLIASQKSNRASVADYFRNEAGWPELAVAGYYLDRMKLYSLACVLENVFNNDMLTHVGISAKLGFPARTALKEFLERNRIEEEELQLDTAYKRWQRQGKKTITGLKIV